MYIRHTICICRRSEPPICLPLLVPTATAAAVLFSTFFSLAIVINAPFLSKITHSPPFFYVFIKVFMLFIKKKKNIRTTTTLINAR